MEPQQRLLLQCAFRATEDAGVPLARLSMQGPVSLSGCRRTTMATSSIPQERANIGPHTNTGGSSSIASNRISYAFDLRGPSLTIDTACSSSLTALHLAFTSLAHDECDYALVGGVNVILKPEPSMGFSKGGFLSPMAAASHSTRAPMDSSGAKGWGGRLITRGSLAEKVGDRVYCNYPRNRDQPEDERERGMTVPSREAQRS